MKSLNPRKTILTVVTLFGIAYISVFVPVILVEIETGIAITE